LAGACGFDERGYTVREINHAGVGRNTGPIQNWLGLGRKSNRFEMAKRIPDKIDGRTVLQLQDGLQLRRAKVMGEHRVELSGFTDGMVDRLKAMDLISEIISWKLRLFVPTGPRGPTILGTLMERYPLLAIADRATV